MSAPYEDADAADNCPTAAMTRREWFFQTIGRFAVMEGPVLFETAAGSIEGIIRSHSLRPIWNDRNANFNLVADGRTDQEIAVAFENAHDQ